MNEFEPRRVGPDERATPPSPQTPFVGEGISAPERKASTGQSGSLPQTPLGPSYDSGFPMSGFPMPTGGSSTKASRRAWPSLLLAFWAGVLMATLVGTMLLWVTSRSPDTGKSLAAPATSTSSPTTRTASATATWYGLAQSEGGGFALSGEVYLDLRGLLSPRQAGMGDR